MREQQDIAALASYGRSIIDGLKTRNNIQAKTAKLVETIYSGGSTTFSLAAYSTTRVRILFTPSVAGNSFSEVGIRYSLIGIGSAYFEYAVYRDPSYTGAASQAWLFIVYVEAAVTLSLVSSVVSAPPGTITQGLA